jgi:hypothetical protein
MCINIKNLITMVIIYYNKNEHRLVDVLYISYFISNIKFIKFTVSMSMIIRASNYTVAQCAGINIK